MAESDGQFSQENVIYSVWLYKTFVTLIKLMDDKVSVERKTAKRKENILTNTETPL